MGEKPLLEARNVSKSFGQVKVLKGLNLTVREGETVCIIGPSGGGKSTFLRCVNFLEKIDSGALLFKGQLVGYSEHGNKLKEWDEKEAAAFRVKVGMVFQHFNLYPHMTAAENVAIGPHIVKGEPQDKALARAHTLLAKVGLSEKVNSYPLQLSGGQQQRVAIARSLANDPAVILADEPTGNLDQKTGKEVMQMLSKLHCEEGKTIVMVTHDNDIAKYAERSVRIKDGIIESTEVNPDHENVCRAEKKAEKEEAAVHDKTKDKKHNNKDKTKRGN